MTKITTKPKLLLPLALLLAATTLSACDVKLDDLKARLGFAPPVEAPAADELNACKLLTQEEATAVLGGELLKKYSGTKIADIIVTSCTYTVSSTVMTTATSSVRFVLQQFSTPEESQRNYEAAREQSKELSGTEPETVADLGENAYWSGGTLNHLGARQGNQWYQIQVKGLDGPKTKAVELLKAALLTEAR